MENSNYQTKSSSKFISDLPNPKKISLHLLSIALIVILPGGIVVSTRSSIAQEAIAQSPNLSKNIIYVKIMV